MPDLSIRSKFHELVTSTMINGGGAPTACLPSVERNQVTLSFSPWVYQTRVRGKLGVSRLMLMSPSLTSLPSLALDIINMLRTGSLRKKNLKAGLSTEEELEAMVLGW